MRSVRLIWRRRWTEFRPAESGRSESGWFDFVTPPVETIRSHDVHQQSSRHRVVNRISKIDYHHPWCHWTRVAIRVDLFESGWRSIQSGVSGWMARCWNDGLPSMVVSGLQSCVNLSKTFLHRFSFIYYVTQSPLFGSKWLFLTMAEKLGFLGGSSFIRSEISQRGAWRWDPIYVFLLHSFLFEPWWLVQYLDPSFSKRGSQRHLTSF